MGRTTTILEIARAITWATEAAREHVSLALFNREEPDPEASMGLWQSFRAAFPDVPGVNRDAVVMAYSTAYSATVKALVAVLGEAKRP